MRARTATMRTMPVTYLPGPLRRQHDRRAIRGVWRRDGVRGNVLHPIGYNDAVRRHEFMKRPANGPQFGPATINSIYVPHRLSNQLNLKGTRNALSIGNPSKCHE